MEQLINFDSISTRAKRRTELKHICDKLNAIIKAELDYLDRMPSNFKDGVKYAETEDSIELIEAALDVLVDVY